MTKKAEQEMAKQWLDKMETLLKEVESHAANGGFYNFAQKISILIKSIHISKEVFSEKSDEF